MNIPVFPLIFASLLAGHGLRKKSLSPNGAATAFLVGFSFFAGEMTVFGVTCIVFYLTGSKATKFGKKKKAAFEDGYHEAGYRSGWQVLSNTFSALIACLVWNVLFTTTTLQSQFITSVIPGARAKLYNLLETRPELYGGGEWCPVDASVADGWSRVLLFAVLGHFACCLGDTLASELGILSTTPPILITTLKTVPPGTNGGMSLTGTLASVSGGLFIGITMTVCLVLENVHCRASWMGVALTMAGWGAVAGGVGSLIDSFLGATVQQTRYSEESKKILQDESRSSGPVKVVSGLNFLTNNQVNVVSSVLTSIGIGLAASA